MPIPATNIRTSHAISIRVGGTTIGQIQSWAPNQSRNITAVHEINAVGTGEPFENAPGIATNLTIQVSRYDLFSAKMEEVWGTKNALWMLTNQHNPIDVEEKWIRFKSGKEPQIPWLDKKLGDPFNWQKTMNRQVERGINTALYATIGEGANDEYAGLVTGAEYYIEKMWYSGCWFSNLGRNMQAQGDRIVMVNATLQYKKVRPL